MDVNHKGIIVVTGSRHAEATMPNLSVIDGSLMQYTGKLWENWKLYHGECRGLDEIASYRAKRMGFETFGFPADWSKGRGAGPIRNQEMLHLAVKEVGSKNVILLAFPVYGEKNAGTKNCIDSAFKFGINIKIYWLARGTMTR